MSGQSDERYSDHGSDWWAGVGCGGMVFVNLPVCVLVHVFWRCYQDTLAKEGLISKVLLPGWVKKKGHCFDNESFEKTLKHFLVPCEENFFRLGTDEHCV